MTREEKQKAIYVLKNSAPVFPLKKPEEYNDRVQAIKQVIDWLEQEPILDKVRTEIEQDLEQAKIDRSVFRYEKINAVKAEQCTGSIAAYHSVIGIIDKYKAESEEK